MGNLKIHVDEEFINKLIDKTIEEKAQIQGLKKFKCTIKRRWDKISDGIRITRKNDYS
ncbi:MAG: hypothetical protein ACOX1K_03490 [Defluviitoga tunisiensis]